VATPVGHFNSDHSVLCNQPSFATWTTPQLMQLEKWEVKDIKRELQNPDKESALWLNVLLSCMWLQMQVCLWDLLQE
jgi:hypothetical protein